MWAVLAALGIVGGLVRLALTEKSDDPVLQPALQRRLAKILAASRRRRLTRTEADDGLVLARRLGEADLARKFSRLVQKTAGGAGERTRRP